MPRAGGGIVPLDGPWTPEGLRKAAEVIAQGARDLSSTWSERVPPSVRVYQLTGRGHVATIAAGGVRAPMAYTFEGKRGGRPVWHPVFARGERSTWRWVPQPPRPFMRPAAEALAGRAAEAFAKKVFDDWAAASGFR